MGGQRFDVRDVVDHFPQVPAVAHEPDALAVGPAEKGSMIDGQTQTFFEIDGTETEDDGLGTSLRALDGGEQVGSVSEPLEAGRQAVHIALKNALSVAEKALVDGSKGLPRESRFHPLLDLTDELQEESG